MLRSCSIDARCKVACKHVRLGQFELFGLSAHQICSQLSNKWICDCASHREAWNNHSYHLFVQFDKNHWPIQISTPRPGPQKQCIWSPTDHIQSKPSAITFNRGKRELMTSHPEPWKQSLFQFICSVSLAPLRHIDYSAASGAAGVMPFISNRQVPWNQNKPHHSNRWNHKLIMSLAEDLPRHPRLPQWTPQHHKHTAHPRPIGPPRPPILTPRKLISHR